MAIVVLFFFLMVSVSSLQTYYCYRDFAWGPTPTKAFYLASVYSMLWVLATPLIFWLGRRLPLERGLLLRNLPIHLFLSVLIGLAHRVIWLWLHFVLPGLAPEWRLTPSRMINDVVASIDYQAMVYWVLLGIQQGASYYRKFQEGRLRATQLEAQLVRAQLQGLKMQLHPHFLFNTLNAITTLMHDDVRRAEEMIVRLSEFLRLSLQSTQENEVPLHRELDFIEHYLAIEKTRFDERLRVEYQIDEDVLNCEVPNLLLQPLVENAIRHGIAQVKDRGLLKISAFQRNGTLSICVANSGPFLASDPLSPGAPGRRGIGLSNTRARLSALYGDAQSLEIRNWHEGGVEALLEIPARASAEIATYESVNSR